MLGAIVGDIVGSRFEFNNLKSKDFALFDQACFVTDDSIMTLAVAKAIMETSKVHMETSKVQFADNGCGNGSIDHSPAFYSELSDLVVYYMQDLGRKYPNCGFGGMFSRW